MPAAWRPGVNYVPGAFQVVSPLLGGQGAPEVGDGHRGDGIALLGHQLQLHASVRPYKEHLTVLVVPLEHSGQGHRGIDMSGGSAAGQKQFHLCLSPFTLIVSLGLCFKLPQPGKEASQSSRRSVRNNIICFRPRRVRGRNLFSVRKRARAASALRRAATLRLQKSFAFSNWYYPVLAAGICRDTLNIMPISANCIIRAVPP